MSNMMVSFSFAVMVNEPEEWPAEDLEKADEDDAPTYQDWVADRLKQVMRKAGEEFMDDNPDLFYGSMVIS